MLWLKHANCIFFSKTWKKILIKKWLSNTWKLWVICFLSVWGRERTQCTSVSVPKISIFTLCWLCKSAQCQIYFLLLCFDESGTVKPWNLLFLLFKIFLRRFFSVTINTFYLRGICNFCIYFIFSYRRNFLLTLVYID